MNFINDLIKDVKQVLILRENKQILFIDLEKPLETNLEKKDLISGFISAIGTFSTSYIEEENETRIVGFGSSNIIINESKTGIIGAIVTKKVKDKQLQFFSAKGKLIINSFERKYQQLLASGLDYDETLFQDIIPVIIGNLIEDNISGKKRPKKTQENKFPEILTKECMEIYRLSDGNKKISEILNELSLDEQFLPLFTYLKLFNLINY